MGKKDPPPQEEQKEVSDILHSPHPCKDLQPQQGNLLQVSATVHQKSLSNLYFPSQKLGMYSQFLFYQLLWKMVESLTLGWEICVQSRWHFSWPFPSFFIYNYSFRFILCKPQPKGHNHQIFFIISPPSRWYSRARNSLWYIVFLIFILFWQNRRNRHLFLWTSPLQSWL